jgi:pyrroline-5-carboxylate reductase
MTHPDLPRLGFLGTGTIAGAMVEGFSTCARPFPIVVSPRNARRSQALAARWSNVRRCGSNQEVLDQAEVVFVALRPPVVPDVLPGLAFRPDHTVVALFPIVHLDRARALVQPAARVFKALPLPGAARHLGQIPYFPEDGVLAALLGHLGEPMPVQSEAEFYRLWAITGLLSTFYAQMQTLQAWCAAHGARPEAARAYTASMMAAMTGMAGGTEPFEALAAEAATPGGLNEMALAMMRTGSGFRDLEAALDAILARLDGEPG